MEDHAETFEFPGVFGWFADNCNSYPEKQHLEMPEFRHLVLLGLYSIYLNNISKEAPWLMAKYVSVVVEAWLPLRWWYRQMTFPLPALLMVVIFLHHRTCGRWWVQLLQKIQSFLGSPNWFFSWCLRHKTSLLIVFFFFYFLTKFLPFVGRNLFLHDRIQPLCCGELWPGLICRTFM